METNGDEVHSVGRPCYLDDRDANGDFSNPKIVDFFNAINAGDFVNDACDYAKISERIIYEYMDCGNKDLQKGLTTKYTQFLQLLKRKQAESRLFHLMKIRNAKDWKASAWYLERKYAKEFCLNAMNIELEQLGENKTEQIVWDIPKIDNGESK